MKGPTPRRLKKYGAKCLGLKSYLQCPGDGRPHGRFPAAALLWGLIMGVLLRRAAFAGIEALVRSRARRALEVSPSFGDDAPGYFTARLDPAVTRRAVVTAVRQAKRHKAFDDCRFLGLALDGTGAGRSRQKVCPLCRPYRNKKREIPSYHHKLVRLRACDFFEGCEVDAGEEGCRGKGRRGGRFCLRILVARVVMI